MAQETKQQDCIELETERKREFKKSMQIIVDNKQEVDL